MYVLVSWSSPFTGIGEPINHMRLLKKTAIIWGFSVALQSCSVTGQLRHLTLVSSDTLMHCPLAGYQRHRTCLNSTEFAIAGYDCNKTYYNQMDKLNRNGHLMATDDVKKTFCRSVTLLLTILQIVIIIIILRL